MRTKNCFILLCLLLFSCPIGAKEKINCNSLRYLCQQATENSDHRLALKYVGLLRRMAEKADDNKSLAYAYYFEGLSEILLGNGEKGKRLLNRAEELSKQINGDTLIVAIYNGYGIYESNVHANYAVAQQYFFKSLEYAKKIHDPLKQAQIETNLAEVAYLLKDTTGLKYALSCYEWARKNDNKQVIFFGAYHCANLLNMMGKPDEALKYLRIADKVSLKEKYSGRCTVYSLYGSIYLALGKCKDAIDYLNMAIAEADNAQAATLIGVYLCYAKVRAAQKLYMESERLIEKGLEISQEKSIVSFVAPFYELQASNHEIMGNYKKALDIFKSYKRACDTIYNVEKERSVNKLRIQYDIEKREQKADYQKLLLDREIKKTMILYLSLLFALLLLSVLYYLYYRQNRLYKKIVLQNRDAVLRKEDLKKKLDESVFGHFQPSTKPAVLNEEKMARLYERLCELMEGDRLYTDSNLTRERLAEVLNTNRTYLSLVINEKAGVGYSQFINDYRIKEAIRVLSDKEKIGYPLKALCSDLGFSSMTTFYKLFQNTVGMTPSIYRKTTLELGISK